MPHGGYMMHGPYATHTATPPVLHLHPHIPQPVPAEPAAASKRRRPSNKDKGKPAAKRARAQVNDAGIGPSALPSQPLPQSNLETVEPAAARVTTAHTTTHSSRQTTNDRPSAAASGGADCWALVIGTNHAKEPSEEDKAAAKVSALAHLKVHPVALQRPSSHTYSRLLCIPCLSVKDQWHTWSNTNGRSTIGPRKHFKADFPHKYLASCARIGYSVDNDDLMRAFEAINEEVTKLGLARYLAEFVAEQDLAFNVVQAPTLRRLLCYVGQNNITAATIPEQHMVAQAASDLSEEAKKQVAKEMQEAEGRVSVTSDLWTDNMDRPFMAVTGHYNKKDPAKDTETGGLEVKLMAFRFIEGDHSGVNLGTVLFGILSEYNILPKLGSITLDNASNNDTMMEELQRRMRAEGHTFDKDGNRICCFPHIINLAVNDVINNLAKSGDVYYDQQLADAHTPSESTMGYLAALNTVGSHATCPECDRHLALSKSGPGASARSTEPKSDTECLFMVQGSDATSAPVA